MKMEITKNVEVEIKTLNIVCHVRYWDEISEDDGIQDYRNGHDNINLNIDVDSGKVNGWTLGKKSELYLKVCDEGEYILKDASGETVLTKEGYVPSCLQINESGYGDYIIMSILEDGSIPGWEADFDDFQDDNED